MSRKECIQNLREAAPAVLPSMLLCDFANLENEIKRLEKANAAALHLDVMDGIFVPNFTYGMTIVQAARRCTDLPLDVHLMMVEPEKYIEQFRDAGADVITIHAEAVENAVDTLMQIRELDAVAGIAVNPETPIQQIENCLEVADLVLVMSVNAGFGGQSFDESVLPKFDWLRENGPDEILLQIDGGINANTIASAQQHGVELFVAGSAIFRNDDYKAAMDGLNQELGAINERI